MRSEVDARFGAFVEAVQRIVGSEIAPHVITARVSGEVKSLISEWTMPDARYLQMQPGAQYGSYLLYRDPDEGFVVIIDTFQAGQATHIHNHRTWAVVATLAGVEKDTRYAVPADLGGPPSLSAETFSRTGDVNIFMEGEFHALESMPGEDAISFHVYGADVGVLKRLRWDPAAAEYGEFIQGYSNEASGLPVYLAESVPAPTR